MIHEDFKNDLAAGIIFDREATWTAFKIELVSHFITIKSIIGSKVEENMDIQPVAVVSSRGCDVRHGSFFTLDNAFAAWPPHVMMANFNVKIAGCTIRSVAVEMALLHTGYSTAFNTMVQFDADAYEKNTDWALVTPDNLLLYSIGRAELRDVKKVDRLMIYAQNRGTTCCELKDLAYNACINSDYDDPQYARLVGLLSDENKRSVSNQKMIKFNASQNVNGVGIRDGVWVSNV
jgi:hypothetical protein